MTRILVDPHQLRSLSVQLQRVSADLQAVEGQLAGALGGLTWEARQKANLDTRASHARGQARELATEVGKMSHYLERKAQMFDEADGRGVPSLLQLSRAHTDAARATPPWLRFPSRRVNALAGLGAVLGAASQIDVLHLPPGLLAALPAFLKADMEFLDIVQTFARSRGDSHSRFVEGFYSTLSSGIPYGGKVDQLLKSHLFHGGLTLVDFGYGVRDDIVSGRYDGDWSKTIGVNLVDKGSLYLIGMTGKGAVVLLVNGLVQTGGNLQVGFQRIAADVISTDEQMRDLLVGDADRVEDAVNRMDLRNISKAFGEGVYDMSSHILASRIERYGQVTRALEQCFEDPTYQNWVRASESLHRHLARDVIPLAMLGPLGLAPELMHPEHRPVLAEGVQNTARAAASVVDGMLDYVVSSAASGVNLKVARTAKGVRSLPVDDSMRNALNEAAKAFIEWNSENADLVVDWIDV